jgi:hypothetical protein
LIFKVGLLDSAELVSTSRQDSISRAEPGIPPGRVGSIRIVDMRMVEVGASVVAIAAV